MVRLLSLGEAHCHRLGCRGERQHSQRYDDNQDDSQGSGVHRCVPPEKIFISLNGEGFC